MYNPNAINKFIEKIHEEAEAAAQAVYDKYQDELLTRIQNQMGEGHTVYVGMGTATISGTQDDDRVTDGEFFRILAATQYHRVSAGVNLPYKIKKNTLNNVPYAGAKEDDHDYWETRRKARELDDMNNVSRLDGGEHESY